VGRGRLGLAALEVGQLGVGALEPADADADHRMVHGEPDSLAHELAAAAGGAVQTTAVTEDVVADVGDGERSDGDDDCGHGDEGEPAPAPGEDRREEHPGHKGGEARLRVREVEPGPDRCDREGRADQHAPVAGEQDRHQQGEDRDYEEAAVDRRVPEDRVDAVERRVGVGDEELRVPEDISRLVLVDPDRREHERHRRHLDEQRERPEPLPGEPRQHDGEQPERQVEEEQVDRALANVVRPEDREADPGGEHRQGPRHDRELSRTRVSAPELPGQEEGGRGDDAVERDEQIRLGRADRDVDARGDAGEGHQRQEPGPAAEQPRAADRERDPEDGGSGQQRPVVVRCEVGRQQDDPERPGAEADESLDPTRRDDQYREPRCADHASRSSELGGHGLTTTTALETWPLAATTRR